MNVSQDLELIKRAYVDLQANERLYGYDPNLSSLKNRAGVVKFTTLRLKRCE